MAYTTIDDPGLYFNTVLYTSNSGSSPRTISGVGFQPDWVWIKNRTATASGSHILNDVVRGTQKAIYANDTSAEYSTSDGLSAFGSDGFTVGNGAIINYNNDAYVAWNWKAGTSFSNDASATSVGTIDSAGSINTDAGFSIISYTGTGSAGTVAHGLGVAPKCYFTKNRDTADNWLVYHEDIGNTKGAFLNVTNTPGTSSAYWNNTSPTSTVFSVGTEVPMNKSGDDIIAYCFAEKQGYSKFGKYTGNGNADGPFLYLGFKPAFFLVKNITNAGYDWELRDNKRDSYNPVGYRLEGNTSDAESSYYAEYDFVSNGIKIKQNGNNYNTSGASYIYIAFAESPFVNSNGIPNNAR